MSQSIPESPLDFEITRVSCIRKQFEYDRIFLKCEMLLHHVMSCILQRDLKLFIG